MQHCFKNNLFEGQMSLGIIVFYPKLCATINAFII